MIIFQPRLTTFEVSIIFLRQYQKYAQKELSNLAGVTMGGGVRENINKCHIGGKGV